MKFNYFTSSLSFTFLFLLFIGSSQKLIAQANCQNNDLEGDYIQIKDSEGTSLMKGASITLSLSENSAELVSTAPDNEIDATGTFEACNNLISISFPDINIKIKKKPFSLSGNMLVLPFSTFGKNGSGSSTWEKITQNTDDNDDEGDDDGGDDGDDDSGNVTPNDNPNDHPADNPNDNPSDNPNNNPNHPQDNQVDNPNDQNNQNNQIDKPQNAYVGEYYGAGRGWEVRFKQTSGEFVSQFSGVNKDDLPYQNDKIIMSLLVQHATIFKINIDSTGNVTGDGEIVYDVIPNLCGVAALTKQVNSAVNMMDYMAFFYKLGSKIGEASVKKFEGSYLAFDGELGKVLKISSDAAQDIAYKQLGKKLSSKMKALNLEGQQANALCNCATGQVAIEGGNAVGPATIQQLVSSFGVDVAKALFMDVAFGKLPVGLLLSIPGVTQVQYYYKGLQNGPETRQFKIKGKLVNGELFLEMDGDVSGGPKKLTIEYMVNYKKETPTFPTWSPFQAASGKMYPANSEVTVYEEKEMKRTEKYKDEATGQEKTIEIPYTVTTSHQEIMPLPYASFREAGQHRNGVKVWHEYEYNWSVYKVSGKK